MSSTMRAYFIPAAAIDWRAVEAGGEVANYVIEGQLTTDHPASSYGLPVLVDEDGTAYGPDEVYEGSYSGVSKAPRDPELEALATEAGYHLESNYGQTATTY